MRIRILILVFPFFLLGQTTVRKDFAKRLKDPTGSSPMDFEGSLFRLNSFQGKETVGLRLSTEKLSSICKKAIFSNWNLTLTGPFDEDEGPARLANFDGFTNTTAVEFGLSIFIDPINDVAKVIPILDGYLEKIIEKETSVLNTEIVHLRVRQAELKNLLRNSPPSDEADFIEREIKNLESLVKDRLGKIDELEDKINSSDDLPDEARNKFEAEVLKEPWSTWAFSVSYKTGEEDFNYVPGFPDMQEDVGEIPDPFEAMKETKRNYAVTGSVGYLLQRYSAGNNPALRPSYIGVSYKYQRSHQASALIDFCRDVANVAGVETCAQAIFGPPAEKKVSIAQGEARFYSKNLGFHPKITWNEKESEVNCELPIYFIRNENGLLTGGASLEYLDDGDEFRLNVFVGSPFKVNP